MVPGRRFAILPYVAASTDIVYTSPREVYAAFEACPLLVKANVRHFWGTINDKPIQTGARAVWQVKRYDSRPPVQQHDGLVQEPGPDGSKRTFKALHKVDVAVTVQVELFTDKNSPVSEWDLFKLYARAAAQLLRVEKRYEFAAVLEPRDQLSTPTDRLTATLVFHIPIHELIPTSNPAADAVSLRT